MYGAGVVGVVMRGMGAGGLNGAGAVHDGGGMVLAQDEATSAVWGMPGRVTQAGIASATLPLWGIAGALKQRVSEGRPARAEAVARPASAVAPRRGITHGLL